ncbi:MAG: hypothetical protein IJX24_02515, partial [Oscillospiraceae bacterium]|nr:hypothetical protein [Oscillospiraceae bacterium]
MKKKIQRVLSGVLAAMFVGQVMIYGDGSSQGIAHAETITEIKESLQLSENADKLADDYKKAVDGLGEVEYFGSPEASVMMINETGEASAVNFAEGLTISGHVKKGVVSGCPALDNTPIYVHIFDGDWAKLKTVKISDGEEFTINSSSSDIYHVKFECDGYLPFYLKDFGTGSYTIGSGESWDTVTLVPGDTKYNEAENNQWSDDIINANDEAFVRSCLGATRGDSDFNPSMDADGDNVISQSDLDAFCDFYEKLGDTEYELPQSIQDLDINHDNVINDTDYKLLEDSGASAEELLAFRSELSGVRQSDKWVYIYNHEMTGDVIVNKDDWEKGVDKINNA